MDIGSAVLVDGEFRGTVIYVAENGCLISFDKCRVIPNQWIPFSRLSLVRPELTMVCSIGDTHFVHLRTGRCQCGMVSQTSRI